MLVLCPVMTFGLCCLITHLCPMPVNLDKNSKVSFKSNNKKIIYCKCASVKHFWSIFTWAQSKGIGKRLLRPGIANISSHHWHNRSNLWKCSIQGIKMPLIQVLVWLNYSALWSNHLTAVIGKKFEIHFISLVIHMRPGPTLWFSNFNLWLLINTHIEIFKST